MAHKVKALQQWCKVRCEGYRDVAITNFTSSWKSGLAFCAIIHRYRPDLIDYDSLKRRHFWQQQKAFDVALHELGIAALLDPEDMVAMTVPDKLCIVTYVAQYYNYFHNKEMLGGPGVKTAVKRSMRMTDVFPSPEPTKNLNEITNRPTAVHAEQKVSVDQINKKLVTLDQQLRVVEAEGRKLEDKIRGGTDDAMDEDEEEVMIEWFALVKQKYELVRDESDLMYRRRQQELEELHEELEYQFRCLNYKPDDEKTYDEKEYEKQLLTEIFEVVKLRDNIVNSIEVDRQRYLQEDEQIRNMMEASGISDAGKAKKKHKKNKKKFPEKRKSIFGFKRSSSMKSPTAKDIE